jgi:hypothetical protein
VIDHAFSELAKISAPPLDALREAWGLARAGEYGEPVRDVARSRIRGWRICRF